MPEVMLFRSDQSAMNFQLHVYQAARRAVIEEDLNSVLDIGCGNPQKLRAYLYPFVDDIVGLDLPEIIDQIDVNFGRWIACDIERDYTSLYQKFNLIIAADVIEHLDNPDKLFDLIKTHASSETIILFSTPERVSSTPINPCHHKEYTKDEMISVLKDANFNVEASMSYHEKKCIDPYISNMFVCLIGD